jgi:hypothetical protein
VTEPEAGGRGVADGGRLGSALERLVERGVLTPSQAEAVHAEVRAVTPPESPGVRPGAEIAAWVGAVLALAAGLTATARFWSELQVWAQSGLLLLAAVALFAAGAWLADDARQAARRIVSVTWLLAVVAFGAAVALPLSSGPPEPEARAFLIAAAASAAVAFPLWRRHESALQLLGIVGAVVTGLLSGLGTVERPPDELYGLLLWAAGAALVLLGWSELARPVRTALATGALGALAGAELLFFQFPRTGVLLGLATVAGLFVLGTGLRRVFLTGIAAVALALFVPEALDAFFPGSLNASATMFVTGAALLIGALATIRRARAQGEET